MSRLVRASCRSGRDHHDASTGASCESVTFTGQPPVLVGASATVGQQLGLCMVLAGRHGIFSTWSTRREKWPFRLDVHLLGHGLHFIADVNQVRSPMCMACGFAGIDVQLWQPADRRGARCAGGVAARSWPAWRRVSCSRPFIAAHALLLLQFQCVVVWGFTVPDHSVGAGANNYSGSNGVGLDVVDVVGYGVYHEGYVG